MMRNGRVAQLLNARLADCIDLQTMCKQAHWNVRGPQFIALHKLFDEIYDAVGVAALSDVLAQFGRETRVGIQEMNELEDAGSADILTEISRGIDKWLWFVEGHATNQ